MRTIPVLLLILLGAAPCLAETLVAVGYGGRRMSTTDGRTWENVQQWTDKGADDWFNLISVCHGKGKFVCVGGGGWSRDTQAGPILVSTDGKTWREVAKYPFRVSPVEFDGKRFVAGGPNHRLLWSEDGEKWNDGADITLPSEIPGWAFWFRKGAVGNGAFIFMGNAGPKQATWWTVVSKDGQTVDHFTTEVPKTEELAFGAGRFLAATKDAVLSSTDGIQWQPVSVPADEYKGVLWTGHHFFLTGKKSTYTSADGKAWTEFGKPPPCRVIFSDGATWIGTGWPGNMYYSADGKAWQKTSQPQPGLGVNSIATDKG